MRLKLITAAAAIAAATSAQAGDLAAPAPAVDYVKICDAYGTGFFYIPGTETCLKIGGFVRAEYRVGDADFGPLGYVGPFSWDARGRSGTATRVRTGLTFDARTSTEYGLLRSYIEWWYEVDTGDAASLTGGTEAELWQGFIQFGGLVAGRTQSFYDFWTGYAYNSVLHPAYSDTKVNLLAYQFAFGNGVSATVSIEDPTTARRDVRRFSEFHEPYGGLRYPDLVANIRVDQAWGSAQIMGALHQVVPNGHSDKQLGWAIGAGIQLNVPWAPGSSFAIQAAYSNGAISYVHSGIATAGNFHPGIGGPDSYLSDYNGDELATAWGISAGYRHVFSPKWLAAINGGWAHIENDMVDGLGQFGVETDVFDIGGVIQYTIVPGFTVGLALEYRNFDFSDSDRTVGISNATDADAWVGLLRFQRNF
jgi:opacity protein-like surface antigen